jgi:hypothetical protein
VAVGGGAVTTAGSLVFRAINDGRLMAYAADPGEKRLDIHTACTLAWARSRMYSMKKSTWP